MRLRQQYVDDNSGNWVDITAGDISTVGLQIFSKYYSNDLSSGQFSDQSFFGF